MTADSHVLGGHSWCRHRVSARGGIVTGNIVTQTTVTFKLRVVIVLNVLLSTKLGVE